MSDVISNMFSSMRNAQMRKLMSVRVPHSSFKESISRAMQKMGYIASSAVVADGVKKYIDIELKYSRNGEPAMREIKRISKPGKRVYRHYSELSPVYQGLGVTLISTTAGIVTDSEARKSKLGGEVICRIF